MTDSRPSLDFHRLVAEHRETVFRAARRVVGNDEDALDVTQETLFKLSTHGRDLPPAARRPWLVRVATHRAIDLLRRRDPLRESKGLDPALDVSRVPADTLELRERRDRVRRALTLLPARQAEIVVLRVFEELSFAAAAEGMGISEGAAKVHFRRALEQLRDRLAPLEPVHRPDPRKTKR